MSASYVILCRYTVQSRSPDTTIGRFHKMEDMMKKMIAALFALTITVSAAAPCAAGGDGEPGEPTYELWDEDIDTNRN